MPRYRRVEHVVCFWRGDSFVVCDYVKSVAVVVPPVFLEILNHLTRWKSYRSIRQRFPDVPDQTLRQLLARLTRIGLLRRHGGKRSTPVEKIGIWSRWAPEPAFFNFSTKNVQFVNESRPAVDATKREPTLTKRIAGERIPLLQGESGGELPAVLRARRTWRRFGSDPVSFRDLSALLALTWGVQEWMFIPGRGRMALKTSPSGGSRHSIEAYVVAMNVRGLAKGLYYFAPAEYALVPVKSGTLKTRVRAYLPGQDSYADAAAVVIMTSVFHRVFSRYPYARSYRAILLEAGHLCQTFCLLATSLGLAPFCTNAFSESLLEKDLGIDGLSEAPIYVAGVGNRPPRVAWIGLHGRMPVGRSLDGLASASDEAGD